MKKWLIVLFTVVIFIFLYYPIILPPFQPFATYSMVPDSEGEYLTTLRMYQGQGWYSSFSYVYPPGKFMLRALLFFLIGPTFSTIGLPMLVTTWLVFPAMLLCLSLVVTERLIALLYPSIGKNVRTGVAYFFAVWAVFLYLAFFRSAQEIHVVSAGFIMLLQTEYRNHFFKQYALGMLLGLAFLFRIDSGILLTAAFFLSLRQEPITHMFQFLRAQTALLFGVLSIWIPVLGVIIFHGSLNNFLYDTLILGLIVQPRFMSLPIPENQFGLFYLSTLIFLLGGSIALFLTASRQPDKGKLIGLRVLAVISSMSYVAVLGRSDEPHLWYGLIWMPLIVIFYTISLCAVRVQKSYQRKRTIFFTMLFAIVIYFFCKQIIYFKNPTLFLVEICVIFMCLNWQVLKRLPVRPILIASLCASLFVFHSLNFLKLKFVVPHPPVRAAFSYHWLQNDPGEVGGLFVEPQTKVVLDQIRADIPSDEKYLFIFPKNVFLNEYFHLTNPTRYTLISLERSDATEREIISRLSETKTNYFLIFPDSAELRDGPVWHWILEHTQLAQQYSFGIQKAELRQIHETDAPSDPSYWVEKY